MSENKQQTEEEAQAQNPADADNGAEDNINDNPASDAGAAVPNEADSDLHLMLEDARNKAESHWNELLRMKAELENSRKRHSKELENAHKFGLEKFIQELLPVWDSMAMGLQAAQNDDVDINSIREGMELTLKMMDSAMDKFNVEIIDPQGEPFNPEHHQAMSMLESADVEPNTVINVMQKGFLLNGRLVRPAMVVVSKAATKPANSAYGDSDEEAGTKIDDQA